MSATSPDPARSTEPSLAAGVPRARLPLVVSVLLLGFLILSPVLGPGSLLQVFGSLLLPPLALAVVGVWWLGFSGVCWPARWWVVGAFLLASAFTLLLADRSMIPYGWIMYGVPLTLTAGALWLAVTRGPFRGRRLWGLVIAILVSPLPLLPLRVDGMDGRLLPQLSLRWTLSAEEQYLRSLRHSADSDGDGDSPRRLTDRPVVLQSGDWPGFRGPERDGIVRDQAIRIDWPEEGLPLLWRRAIGPGWSSFAVVDGRLYTQEQRGEMETVLCLDADTGEEVWSHSYPARFYEVVANTGPRATPTFHDGRVYALGATGILTALDAATGTLLWQADVMRDSGAEVPEWGCASSPLVVVGLSIEEDNADGAVDDIAAAEQATVIVLAGDPGAKVVAYRASDGQVRWMSDADGGLTYSSPALMDIGGVPHVVSVDGQGAYGWDPHSGQRLWRNEWSVPGAARIVQPVQVGPSGVIFGTGYGLGSRRLEVRREGGKWQVDEVWTSRDLKPYFNDFVLHDGNLYGFDHQIMACVDAATGERRWKRGRYGFGQLVLVRDQSLVVVLSDSGEAVLLPATPDRADVEPLARFQALEGKTWNHPVIAHGRLYLRNAQEAACFDIAP